MDSGYPQPDVDVTDDLLIGAALLAPSFCDDLSTWRMTVARDGTIKQELRVPYHSEIFERVIVHLQSWASPSMIADLEATARSIEIGCWKESYHAASTDMQQTSITINLDGRPKRVTAYGPQELAVERNGEMIAYMRLWDKLLEIAPYRRMECHAAPEERVIQRIRSLFGEFLS